MLSNYELIHIVMRSFDTFQFIIHIFIESYIMAKINIKRKKKRLVNDIIAIQKKYHT